MSNELRVFISSTLIRSEYRRGRDLQEEREHLMKKIFPEIRSLCRERGVRFTEVDLRWGLTEEQAVHGTVIRTCLEEIDKCRPYFIGMIGGRYGWVPELHEIMIDPELLSRYPWIEDATLDGASVTEMEFIHGVFAQPEIAANAAFFYHRSGNAAEIDNAERLVSLIDRARATGHPFREFGDVEQLGEQVRADLVAMIESYWPEESAPTALELEQRAHAAFVASRKRAYIPNPEYLKEFTAWLASGEKSLVITGASGLGKSSLVAYLVESYRRKQPTAFIIEHYIGASQSSGSSLGVMRHVIEEIRDRFAIDEPLPEKAEEIERSFPNWLFRLEHLAVQQGIEVLVVIDAVNQLDEAGRRLAWLPMTIPVGVKLVISTTPGESEDQLSKREWHRMDVMPIDDQRVRQSIIARYLGEFHKGVSVEQLRRLTDDAKAASPLYLRVVAEELRLHGEHETLDEEIMRHTSAVDLDEVFQGVLQRLERDYGDGVVRGVLASIWASRSGLSEVELLELEGLTRLELSRLLLALDYHLLQKDGLLGFFHDYLRWAVEKRYLAGREEKRAVHLRLADYFQSVVTAAITGREGVPLRVAAELPYQLHAGEESDRLAQCLATMPVFTVLYDGEMQYDMLEYWTALGAEYDVESACRMGLVQWRSEDAEERSKTLGGVAKLLERLGKWDGALGLQRERLALTHERGDKSEEAHVRLHVGWLLFLHGKYVESFDQFSQARDLYGELGNRYGVARAIGNMGREYVRRGDNEQALECYQQWLSVAEELGDRSSVAIAIGNIGVVYYYRGEYDRALESYDRQLRICEELGDRSGSAGAIINMGNVYSERGENDRALKCYDEGARICGEIGNRHWLGNALVSMGRVHGSRGEYDRALASIERYLQISEELGDRSGVASAMVHMGVVYYRQGEHDRALESYERHLQISEELGNRSDILLAIGNMGMVYSSRGEHDRALASLHRAAEEHRAIGERSNLSEWLQGIAETLLEIVATAEEMPEYLSMYVPGTTPEIWHAMALRRARECATEYIAISDALSTPDTQLTGRVLLARIEAAEGNVDRAVEQLGAMLAEATDDEQRAELHYRLWKLRAAVGATRQAAQLQAHAEDSSTSSGEALRLPDHDPHHSEALRLYESLFARTPKHDYLKRIEELEAAGE